MLKYLRRVKSVFSKIDYLYESDKIYDLKNPKVLMGRIMAELTRNKSISSFADVEFQVFSQFGDDGIIQYLVSNLDIPHKTFIEFGVENYTESNTRFLLVNNNWSGLVMDGLQANIDYIKKDPVTVLNELHVRCVFITTENINKLMQDFLHLGYDKEVGLLSIDIDGNDYWVWKEITAINPIIVVTEYNAVFGTNPWTVPYKPDFYRLKEHSSHQYWGASLKSFCLLAEQKGYYFVGCNSAGNNAYFVRKDKIGKLKPLSCEEGFVMSKFMEDVDADGNGIHGSARFHLLKGASVVNVQTGQVEKI
jgi:hypothetical protein